MIYILSMIVFSLAVSLKGGWLGNIFTNWDRLVKKVDAALDLTLQSLKQSWHNRAFKELLKCLFVLPFQGFVSWFLNGFIISVFLIFAFTAMTQTSLSVAFLVAIFWMLIRSSMGEEAGAAGDYKGAWGEYLEARNPDGQLAFTRSYGIKKGIQYGCFFGAGISMALGSWAFWIAAATFPLCYFIGSSIGLYFTGQRGWHYAEPLYGAVLGLGYALAINNFLSF